MCMGMYDLFLCVEMEGLFFVVDLLLFFVWFTAFCEKKGASYV